MADSPSKNKSGGKPRGKDRERSRSPARLRASRGAKKKSSAAEMTLEEMVCIVPCVSFNTERLKLIAMSCSISHEFILSE